MQPRIPLLPVLNQNRERFSREREGLIQQQGEDRDSVKAGWKRLNEGRKEAFEKVRRESLDRKSTQPAAERPDWSARSDSPGAWRDGTTEREDDREKVWSWWDYQRRKGRVSGPFVDWVSWEAPGGKHHANWLIAVRSSPYKVFNLASTSLAKSDLKEFSISISLFLLWIFTTKKYMKGP